MAAGLVFHDITTSSGVTFTIASWVPDTSAPNVSAKPIHLMFDTAGNEVLTAAQVTALLGYVDGLEGKLDTLHTDLATTIAGHVDGIEALLGGTLTVGSHAVTNAGTFPVQAAGDIAHDAADSGSPVKLGGKATTSLSGLTLVGDADRTNMFAGIDGVQIVRPHCNLEDIVSAVVTCTSGANTSAISAQGSGVKFYLTSCIIRNAGSANGNLLLTDGNGGTTKADIPFPASTGAIFNPPVPIPFTANTAVYADPSGSDNIVVTLVGFKSKV